MCLDHRGGAETAAPIRAGDGKNSYSILSPKTQNQELMVYMKYGDILLKRSLLLGFFGLVYNLREDPRTYRK